MAHAPSDRSFGEFVKRKRQEAGLGLREFCLRFEHDASNWSKIERGVKAPPKDDPVKLAAWATQLGLKAGTDEWIAFHDLAALAHGRLPTDFLSNEELMGKLPLFFRSLRDERPTDEDIRTLINILRNE